MRAPGGLSAYLSRMRRRLPLGVGIGAVVGVVLWALSAAGALDELEHVSFNARAKVLSEPANADTSIVIVAIDDNSLEAARGIYGRWPWPRDAHAMLVGYLR